MPGTRAGHDALEAALAMQLTISTWNINSVRLRINLVAKFIKAERPDVLCLQETKCPDDAFPRKRFARLGYTHIALNGQKGYHGVAVVSASADDTFITVVIEETSRLVGTSRLMLMVGAKDFQLRQWTVTDPQGFDTTVAVYNLDTSKKPDPSLFKITYADRPDPR